MMKLRNINKIQRINNLLSELSKFNDFKEIIPLIINAQNVHFRFEDEHFINDNRNFVFGLKLESFIFKFLKESNLKNMFFKLNNLDIYWEPITKNFNSFSNC